MCWRFRCSLFFVLLLGLATSGFTAAWNGGRGPGNRGSFTDVTFPTAPAMVWKSFLGNAYINLPPSNTIFAGNMLVVAFDRYLVGLSAATGVPRWRQDLSDRPLGDLQLVNGLVVASLPKGYAAGYNPADGQLIWRRKLAEAIRNEPILSGQNLLYATKANKIEGLDSKTGNVEFTRDANGKIESGPAILGRSLVLCYAEGEIARIDEGGVIHWAVQIPNAVITLNPTTDGRTVIVTANNAIYALNPTEREEHVVWSYSCPDRLSDSAVIDNNHVYFANKTGLLYCLDLATGKDLWTHVAGADNRGKAVIKPGLQLLTAPVAQPLIFGNNLLVRMNYGLLALYRKDTGELKWLYRLPTSATAGGDTSDADQSSYLGAPAISSDRIFFAATDGCVYHLSVTSPDIDPPTFSGLIPDVPEKGFLQQQDLQFLGAVVTDEGSGVDPTQVQLKLDGHDLTAMHVYDPRTGYFYCTLDPQTPLAPGLHRLVMAAKDYRGNVGTVSQTFILGYSNTAEQLEVKIAGEFLPKTLQVRPGTIVTWTNASGDLRSVVADTPAYAKDLHLTSDVLYPDGIPNGESWVWIVPQDLDFGTVIYYHCRLKGSPGDGKSIGNGLAGMLVVTDIQPEAPAGEVKPKPGDNTPPGPLLPGQIAPGPIPPGPVVPPGPVIPPR